MPQYRPIDMTHWAPIDAGAYFAGEPLRIDAGTHLLGHGGLVEDRRGLVRRVTPPERAGQVLEPELPWEHVKTFGPTVLADERSGTLRMWYGTLPPLGGRPGKLVIPPYLMLYAESEDGLRWRKPLLDLVSDGEHRRTNILYRGAHDNCSAFSVVIDRADPDPSRRYKMLHKGGKDSSGRSGEELAFSADGLRWRPYEGNPVMPQRHDCNLNLLYDTARGMWTAYLRPYAFGSGIWPGQAGGRNVHHRRRVAIAESRDLIAWSKVRTVLGPGEGDRNEFDSIAIFPHGSVLVGLIATFEENDLHDQRMQIEVAFSTDGHRWERAPGTEPFLQPTGHDGDFDRDSVGVATAGLDPVPATAGDAAAQDRLLFYTGSRWTPGQLDGRTAIGALRIRRDRFVEQHAAEEGWLLTRELVLDGAELQVNCRADGELRVELAEYPGQAIPGFALADCDPIIGDHVARTVTWGGSPDLSRLRGRPVYIRFHLRAAGIWAFRVA